MVDWKKDLELLNEKTLKSLEFFRTSAQEPYTQRPGSWMTALISSIGLPLTFIGKPR